MAQPFSDVDVVSALLRPDGVCLGRLHGHHGTGSLGAGELLVCERPVDGFSWSPPGRPLQADTMRKLVVVEDVVLKSSFPELLPAGPTARLLRVPVWWPTQTNRQGDGGALGPHVVARGGIQIN